VSRCLATRSPAAHVDAPVPSVGTMTIDPTIALWRGGASRKAIGRDRFGRNAPVPFARALSREMHSESATSLSSAILPHGRRLSRAASASDPMALSPKRSLGDLWCSRCAARQTLHWAETHATDALRTDDTRGDLHVKRAYGLCYRSPFGPDRPRASHTSIASEGASYWSPPNAGARLHQTLLPDR
jgi:hypothetical protein